MNKIIATLFISYVVVGFVHGKYLDSVDILFLSESESILINILGIVKSSCLYVGYLLLSISLLSAFKESATKAAFSKYVACVCIGLMYCGIFSYLHIMASSNELERPSILKSHPDFLDTYEDYLNSGRAAEEKIEGISRKMASTIYVDEEIIVEVLDGDGRRVKYVPTENDKEIRLTSLRAWELIEWSNSAIKESMYTSWCFLFLTIIFTTFLCYWREAYNKVFKRDAASGAP